MRKSEAFCDSTRDLLLTENDRYLLTGLVNKLLSNEDDLDFALADMSSTPSHDTKRGPKT